MAKRKRLTPAEPERADLTRAPETKSAFPLGVAPKRIIAPISQVAGDASTTAALEDLAQEMRLARASGRLVQAVPENQIEASYLVRDRIAEDDEDMQALMQSLKSRGQQTPVELVELGTGRFGLISGWRRLSALRRLLAETGEQRFGMVLGVLRDPETAADAYQAMIEENEIRVGLSYYERARIAAKAVEQGVYPDEKKALLALFATASRAKRSKIRSFLPIYHNLDEVLRYAGTIPERLGLRLSKALDADPDFAARMKARLLALAPQTARAEQNCLADALSADRGGSPDADKGLTTDETGQGRADIQMSWSGKSLILKGAGVTPELADRLRLWIDAPH